MVKREEVCCRDVFEILPRDIVEPSGDGRERGRAEAGLYQRFAQGVGVVPKGVLPRRAASINVVPRPMKGS